MKLLILGDMGPTGFGTVTMALGRRLLHTHDVRFLSLNERDDLEEPFASRTASLGTADGWLMTSDDPAVMAQTAQRLFGMFSGGIFPDGWAPDSALVIGDMGSLFGSPVLEVVPEGFPLYHYCPIEGEDIPPRWAQVWAKASPIAMTEFGASEMAHVIGHRPPVVYHGVDTEQFHEAEPFRPVAVGGRLLTSRAACRAHFGIPANATVLLRTDRNMPRKAYPSLLRSLAPVLGRNPGTVLFIHCAAKDLGGDLEDEKSKYRPEIAARMVVTDQGGRWKSNELCALYNSADLYVSNCPEGFGLTIAEAMACGTPAVGLDYSAVPEVIGHGGQVVPVGALIDSPYGHFWATPNEEAYASAVEYLVRHRHQREQLGMLAAMHIRRSFSWDEAAAQMSQIMSGASLEVAV